ncbi:hypothetical protein PP175_14235 [Aneurinibacillus sp. Ricciae_BoGa-3]|uniref:hypothetical protein n=1 Tax=Aneurinibacillus sp. Ricciae_BoGa-3 TaxID=3022697 RepID=UPI00233FEB92|nr:hypothetical protein [Aneurinibacillus sp. Ricciae_BoGa-3]WCK52592.1 hypothetical protein PP175_14235 [Aneurinibacillus sp. Ricciae_BoGa-3]
MDPALVEKITRLVLSKLEEYVEYAPLTEEEMKTWRDITSSMEVTKMSALPLEAYAEYLPLTQEDIKIWKDITSSIEATKHTKHSSPEGERADGQVKFYQYYQ